MLFSRLGTFDPVHPFVFWGLVVGASALALLSFRRSRETRTALGRWGLHAVAVLLGAAAAGVVVLSHHVREDQVGIARSAVLKTGVHVWPKEASVRVARVGAFTIPYPNERLYLLVEYRIANPEQLVALHEELRAIQTGLRRDFFRESVVGEESWRGSEDALAVFLQKRLRGRLPSNPTPPGHLEYSLEPVLGAMRELGIRGEVFLVKKDLLRST